MPEQAASAPAWGVLLAAGASTRMGRHKLLLDVGGEPLVRRVARQVLAARVAGLLVVTGREPERVQAALEGLPCRFVHNSRYAEGELPSSVAVGLEAVHTGHGALLVLADMPFVGPEHFRRVLDAADGVPAVVSVYGEVLAPPHFIGRGVVGQVVAYARQSVSRPLPPAVVRAARRAGQPAADLMDVDDAAGYAAVVARLGGR